MNPSVSVKFVVFSMDGPISAGLYSQPHQAELAAAHVCAGIREAPGGLVEAGQKLEEASTVRLRCALRHALGLLPLPRHHRGVRTARRYGTM